MASALEDSELTATIDEVVDQVSKEQKDVEARPVESSSIPLAAEIVDLTSSDSTHFASSSKMSFRRVPLISESSDFSVEGVDESGSDNSDTESVSSTRILIESDPESEKEFEQYFKKLPSREPAKKRPSRNIVHEYDNLPPLEDLKITCTEGLTHFGQVSYVVDCLVVIRPECPVVLDIGSILFTESGESVGEVFDVFGPVLEPQFVIRCNSPAEAAKFTPGFKLSYAKENHDYTRDPFKGINLALSGVMEDESGCVMSKDDEYEPCFSDDEKEKEYYASKRGNRSGNGNTRKRPHKTDSADTNTVAQRGSNRGRALYNRGGGGAREARGQARGGNYFQRSYNQRGDYSWNAQPSYGFPPPHSQSRGHFRGGRRAHRGVPSWHHSHHHMQQFQQNRGGFIPTPPRNPFAQPSTSANPIPQSNANPNERTDASPAMNSSANPYAEFGCYSTPPRFDNFLDHRYQGN